VPALPDPPAQPDLPGPPGRVGAVVFDVDFTLIYPGPMFQGEGYRAFCERHRIDVDPTRFTAAVASASSILDDPEGSPYDAAIFVAYTRHIIEQMGGKGSDASLDACAREIYAEWAANQHFEMYDDVPDALRALTGAGIRIGLISNSHRCLDSFQSHFELREYIAASVSSVDHGYMKPHPSIFHSVLDQLGVAPADAVMVGDSVSQDIRGALRAGMRAVLLQRSGHAVASADELRERGVPTINRLPELVDWVMGERAIVTSMFAHPGGHAIGRPPSR
jgi:putative hydrolase of the HAD superfamily